MREATRGRMQVVLTMGVGRSGLLADIMRPAAKRGRVVMITNIYPADQIDVRLSTHDLSRRRSGSWARSSARSTHEPHPDADPVL
jgi:hypothetical protein